MTFRPISAPTILALAFIALGSVAWAPTEARAQDPGAHAVYYACYVPRTGAVYMIRGTDLPAECRGQHVEFSFTYTDAHSLDGANGDSTDVVFVDDIGRVGIGKTTPLAKLDVAGQGRFTVVRGPALQVTPTLTVNNNTGRQGVVATTSFIDRNTVGTAVNGHALSTTGRNVGVRGIVESEAGTAGMFYNNAGGKILSGRTSGDSEVFSVAGSGDVNAAGTVTAGAFVGNGSGLTGVIGDFSLEGVHHVVDGFAVTGEFGTGNIPVEGPGVRMMWYPAKAAFRAGGALFDWDEVNIGEYSTAMGYNGEASGLVSTAMGSSTTASGEESTAMGGGTEASGDHSTAMGEYTEASGDHSTAMGYETVASGGYSTAMGRDTEASGAYSVAMGYRASTNGHNGAFVFGDASSTLNYVEPLAPNQFVVRASGGFRFYTSSNLSTGCNLLAGSGSWDCTSSRLLKTDIGAVDGEDLLASVRELPIQTWSYKTETGVLHLGPFAEDFHQAFGLGTGETSIGLLDIAGVNLAAVKALERRTRELQQALEAKDMQIAELLQRIERLEKQR